MLKGKSILGPGGTGSFGTKFVGTVLERYDVRRLIVFSRDEQKHFEMAQRFSDQEFPAMRYFIGDVRDRDRLEQRSARGGNRRPTGTPGAARDRRRIAAGLDGAR